MKQVAADLSLIALGALIAAGATKFAPFLFAVMWLLGHAVVGDV